MSGVDRLIVGTSGSPGSLQALRYGESLARAHHAVLVPVIAWELPGDDRAHRISSSHELDRACWEIARQQLRDALIAVWGEVPDDPLVQPRVERGPAGRVLVNLACRPGDVLVMGAGGSSATMAGLPADLERPPRIGQLPPHQHVCRHTPFWTGEHGWCCQQAIRRIRTEARPTAPGLPAPAAAPRNGSPPRC